MLTTMSDLPAGFADGVLSAQSTFRAVMEAMARPGSVQRVGAAAGTPSTLMHATSALALTLFDHDTAIWLDPGLAATSDVAAWLKFHTGAPIVDDPASAGFALVAEGASLPDLERFALGSSEYPDRSTTVILQVESLTEGRSYELRGPGIDGAVSLKASIAPDDLFGRLAINARLFPRGIDAILVHDDSIVAIPRTTRLTAVGG
jgi:alpha-D-ribose 1-methylphosphonate 5-triphosphate synthase subunit PhnH